jgi:trans-2,3-dihydro-3-hydroxyanthranilate isomerase
MPRKDDGMTSYPFYIVDVFAEEKYAGNQLAVVRHAHALSSADMQRLAKEMNYSETTFLTSESPRNNGYDVRIFTPEAEVPFAGHPTLGTAYIIQRELIQAPVDLVNLNLQVGQLPVTFTYRGETPDILWMQQNAPTFGDTLSPPSIAEVLGLDISMLDERFPIQEVSTGLPTIIVPLKTLQAVKQARIARDVYFNLVQNTQAKLILIFCPQAYEQGHHLNVRVFADYFGIPEDPATGSANGCLAGYLAHHQ